MGASAQIQTYIVISIGAFVLFAAIIFHMLVSLQVKRIQLKRAKEVLEEHLSNLEGIVEERTAQIQELERQRTEIEKVAATGRMAARIAHEIINPLAGIKNSFRLIKDTVPSDHKYYKYVSMIDKEIDRIASIVQQMFYLYRPMQEEAQGFLLKNTIDEIVTLLEPACKENGVSIKTKIAKGIETVAVSENLLRQILYNLLLNAIEASPPGAFVVLEIGLTKNKLKLEIINSGKGIPKDDSSRIFEPFFSTKNHLAKSGLGLGLSISKSLVEAMRGEISFTSTPGKGTSFRVILPHQN